MFSNIDGIFGASGGGQDGKSLEFEWKGTELGVKQEGQPDFVYTDLKGQKGDRGATGSKGADGTNYLTQEQANKAIIGVSIAEDKSAITFTHVDGTTTVLNLV